MNRKTSDSHSNQKVDANLFSGVCSNCGEVYEAKSALEDLQGITFKCKKIFCRGQVTLDYSKGPEVSSHRPSSSSDKDPRRYC